MPYARESYDTQEDDLKHHAASVESQYGALFDKMHDQLNEYINGHAMAERAMHERSHDELRMYVAETYEEYGRMYDRLEEYTERYVDSIAAAYEAIDGITKASIDRQVQISTQGYASQTQPVINVNVTLSDVTIRETADIDKLAQQLAKRVDQVTRSRIGR